MKLRQVIIALILFVLVSFHSFADQTQLSIDFNGGNSLKELGFSGTEPTYWMLDSSNYCMVSCTPGDSLGFSRIYTPGFSISRNNKLVINWNVKFLGMQFTKGRALSFLLTDNNGVCLYALKLVSKAISVNGDMALILSKNQDGMEQVIKRVTIDKTVSLNQWLKFRMELNPVSEFDGNGVISVFMDNGNGAGFEKCLRVVDETYTAFNKLCLLYQSGSGKNISQICIDNIKVRSLDNAPLENLLSNPDFRSGMSSWTYSSDWYITQSEGYQGSQAIMCDLLQPGSYVTQGKDYQESIAGKTFIGTAMIRVQPNVVAQVSIRWKDGFGRWIEDTNGTIKRTSNLTDWQKVRVEAEAPLGATQAWLYIQPDKSSYQGTIWLDNCRLVEMSQPNILINPKFDDDFTNWTASSSWSIATDTKYNGPKASYCLIPSGGSADLSQGIDCHESIEGIAFIATGYIKSNNVTKLALKLQWKNAQNEWVSRNLNTVHLTGTHDWMPLSVSGIAPVGATQIWLVISPECDGQGEIWVDSFDLEEIVTPNLLKNNGFENQFVNWTTTGTWNQGSATRFGDVCAKTAIQLAKTREISQGCDYGRDISGIRFSGSAWVKTSAAINTNLTLRWKDNNNNWITGYDRTININEKTEWTELKIEGIAPPGASQVWLVVSADGSNQIGEIWIDQCALRPRSIAGLSWELSAGIYTLKFKPVFNLPVNIQSYEWDMNNDRLTDSYIEEPIYTFNSPGECPVQLRIRTEDGATSETWQTIVVPQALDLNISWSETSGFELTPIFSTDATFSSANWDFGDGTTLNSNELKVMHAYQNGGTYNVQVTITDSLGETLTKSIQITAPPGIEASVSMNTTAENGINTTHFTVMPIVHYGGSLISATWDFGDGQSGSGQSVDHIYASPGAFEPKVTLKDSFGYTYVLQAGTVQIETTAQPNLSLSDGQLCQGMIKITGDAGYSGIVSSIELSIDGVQQDSVIGSNSIEWDWDTFLWINGSHQIEIKLILPNGTQFLETRTVTVANPIYQIRFVTLD